MHPTITLLGRQLLRPAPPSITPLTPSASRVVLSLLLTTGPLTTQSLHSALHAPSPTGSLPTLPPRPLPLNFLRGLKRTEMLRDTRPEKRKEIFVQKVGKDGIGLKESGEGGWSKGYLKRVVLKTMEERGELVKVTRAKWEKLTSATAKGGAAGEGEKEVETDGEKAVKLDEHVWVVGEKWERLIEEYRKVRQQGGLGAHEGRGERELRESYGLRA